MDWKKYFEDYKFIRDIKKKLNNDNLMNEYIIYCENKYGNEKTFPEYVYLTKELPIKTCDKGKKLIFANMTNGYKFCKINCECFVKHSQKKIIKTNLERYGVPVAAKAKKVKEKMKQTNLERYGVISPTLTEEVKEKIKQTNLERYGCENVFQSEKIKDKIKQTNLEKYGVANSQQSSEVKEKVIKTNLERYGFDNPSKSEIIKDKIRNKLFYSSFNKFDTRVENFIPNFSIEDYKGCKERHSWTCKDCGTEIYGNLINGSNINCYICFPPYISNPQKEIVDFLSSYGIKTDVNNRTIIKPKEIDIFLPDYNIGIEYCGVYWHTDRFINDKNYHLNKQIKMEENNYKLITIFGYESMDIVKHRLKSILKLNKEIIYGRKTEVKEITQKEANMFLDTYHLMGHHNAKFNYGLFYNNELISVMTFSLSRYKKDKSYELIRYASKEAVIGGPNKLLKKFIETVKPTKIITYSDKRWGDGEIYKKLGFILDHESKPGYFWVDNNSKCHHRSKFTKKHLVSLGYDNDLTENEIMKNIGYHKLWDCGQQLYILIL